MQDMNQSQTIEVNKIMEDGFLKMACLYAKMYSNDPKTFVSCFLKFQSVRTCCTWIVKSFKDTGSWEDCLLTGKDFTEYANKQALDENGKRVLADTLLIIYSILNQ